MSCVCYNTYISKLRFLDWTVQKKRTRVPKSCTVGFSHQLDGFSMNKVAGRSNGEFHPNTCTCRYVANSSVKQRQQRRFKNAFTKIVHLLAFVGNGRSIVQTRTLIFAGACAKPFAKIQLLVPTNNSTLVNTFSDQRRTWVQLRRIPTQLPCSSWSARSESFHNRVQKNCGWLQDTYDGGRRILFA